MRYVVARVTWRDNTSGSVRGLLRPQTTIDAPSVDDSSARTSSGFSPESVLLESRMPSPAAADATIGSSGKWADDCPRQCLSLGQSSAQFPKFLLRREGRAWNFGLAVGNRSLLASTSYVR